MRYLKETKNLKNKSPTAPERRRRSCVSPIVIRIEVEGLERGRIRGELLEDPLAAGGALEAEPVERHGEPDIAVGCEMT